MPSIAGSERVAPNLLVRLIRLAVREVPGVARPGTVLHAQVAGATAEAGVAVRVHGNAVTANCYVIAAPETNLLELGITVQVTVAAVIEDIAGMVAHEVNVYIQDVEISRG